MNSFIQMFFLVMVILLRISFIFLKYLTVYICLSRHKMIDITDAFSEFGQINNARVNLDSLTGFCKGYALIEYTKKSEAQDAINALHGKELLGKVINVDWAFVGMSGVTREDDSNTRPKKQLKGRR